jgi:hypothetical protein
LASSKENVAQAFLPVWRGHFVRAALREMTMLIWDVQSSQWPNDGCLLTDKVFATSVRAWFAARLRAEVRMESAYKQMRLMWVFFLVAEFIYIALPEMLHTTARPIQPMMYWLLLGMSMMELAAIVVMRKFTVSRSEDILRATPSDAAAILRWRQGQLSTFAIASAIVLFGLVLRFIGSSLMQVVPFYVVGIAAMIVFKPKDIS